MIRSYPRHREHRFERRRTLATEEHSHTATRSKTPDASLVGRYVLGSSLLELLDGAIRALRTVLDSHSSRPKCNYYSATNSNT